MSIKTKNDHAVHYRHYRFFCHNITTKIKVYEQQIINRKIGTEM